MLKFLSKALSSLAARMNRKGPAGKTGGVKGGAPPPAGEAAGIGGRYESLASLEEAIVRSPEPARTPTGRAEPKAAATGGRAESLVSLEEAVVRSPEPGRTPARGAEPEATTARAELIRQALKIQRDKVKIFAELTDDERKKLRALAVKMLSGDGTKERKRH